MSVEVITVSLCWKYPNGLKCLLMSLHYDHNILISTRNEEVHTYIMCRNEKHHKSKLQKK